MTKTHPTASDVVRHLAADIHSRSGWLRDGYTRHIVEPRQAYLEAVYWWVSSDGHTVSGSYGCPSGRFWHRYNWFEAWRIRRAVRRWEKRLTPEARR